VKLAAVCRRGRRPRPARSAFSREITAAEPGADGASAYKTCGGPPAIAVLAVKAEPLRGRFASLDRSARRWPFGFQVALVTKSGRKAAFAHQRDLIANCRAEPAQSPEGPKRSGGAAQPLDGDGAAWLREKGFTGA
jgi:hypothetical protein